MALLGLILGALVSLVERVLSAYWTQIVALLAGLVLGAAGWSWWTSPNGASPRVAPGKLGAAIQHTPAGIQEIYRPPDSTRRDTVAVPVWFPDVIRDTVKVPDVGPTFSRSALRIRGPALELPYFTVPVQDGATAVDVTSDELTIYGARPSDGRGLSYSYDVSRPAIAAGPTAWGTLRGDAYAGISARWRLLRVRAGYDPFSGNWGGQIAFTKRLSIIE